MTFRIDAQRVAHETVDDEVVILDQVAGTYYRLVGPGVAIQRVRTYGFF